MTTITCSTNQRETIELSLADINYDGDETHYTPAIKKTADLQQVLTSHNYSPIIWARNYRNSDNFLYSTGFCVDNDSGLSIQEAKDKLAQLGANYALITTRSHTPQAHRFRILLPFRRKVYSLSDYKRIVNDILNRHFPSSDPKVRDGARQLYGSPQSAEYSSCWDGNDYDVDVSPSGNNDNKIRDAWTDKLIVCDSIGQSKRATELPGKTVILCPFHEDKNTSAFIDYSKPGKNHYIHCSTCGKTYWKEKQRLPIEEQLFPYYSYREGVFEIGLAGEHFFIESIGKPKFLIRSDAQGEDQKRQYFEYLVREKHIRHLVRIDHMSDMDTDESYLEYIAHQGIIEVHYAATPVRTRDNQFIEKWLAHDFDTHKTFIKEWLAVYCYTNYRKLPTLVLKGDRGSGKNTFAEMVMAIFPSISRFWDGETKNFTPEVEKKLLVADESVSASERQYRMLKQRSGQKMAVVNQKFVPEYQVRNNMNIVILSNSPTPIFVHKNELPTSEKNNQFFVYEMKPREGDVDDTVPQKLDERLGHYLRTELRDVYDRVKDYTDCRYGIPTPITDAERALFDVNMTGLEAEVDKILQKMVGYRSDPPEREFNKFLDDGLFPSKILDDHFLPRGYTKSGILRNLKERGYLEHGEPSRKMVDNKREYCYRMTDKLIQWLMDQESVEEEEPSNCPSVPDGEGNNGQQKG